VTGLVSEERRAWARCAHEDHRRLHVWPDRRQGRRRFASQYHWWKSAMVAPVREQALAHVANVEVGEALVHGQQRTMVEVAFAVGRK
jgi:hypothetical protein